MSRQKIVTSLPLALSKSLVEPMILSKAAANIVSFFPAAWLRVSLLLRDFESGNTNEAIFLNNLNQLLNLRVVLIMELGTPQCITTTWRVSRCRRLNVDIGATVTMLPKGKTRSQVYGWMWAKHTSIAPSFHERHKDKAILQLSFLDNRCVYILVVALWLMGTKGPVTVQGA